MDAIKEFEYDGFDNMLRYYSQGYHDANWEGRPVYIEILGEINHNAKSQTEFRRALLVSASGSRREK
uniref:Uncharacterized protein n=1 Tax=Leersia perrieri TaxID=77586 RepID=A0A0D9WVA9_9ORYZ